MGLIMKTLRGCLQIIGGVVVVLFVLGIALGALSKGKSDSTTNTPEVVQEQVETTPDADADANKEAEEKAAAEPESTADDNNIDEVLLRPEFKEAMDSYEAFFDEYVEVMKAYQEEPTNTELMMRMSDLMAQEADMLAKFDAWENDDSMTTAETAYYLEVHSRIYAKLAEVM